MHREIDEIRTKRARNPWPKYLNSLKIKGLRAWNGEEVRFEFPITVLAGENGSGKSTVLKAAACAYAAPDGSVTAFYPSTFFPDTAWDEVREAVLTYRLREGEREREYSIRKPTARWRFPGNRARRYVVIQDVSRTLPIDATVGYAYLAKRKAQEVSAQELSIELTRYFSSIMGRNYDSARFALSDLDAHRKVGVVQAGRVEFSQFHQGAGEDSTLDLIALLQNVPDTSLILIDEVEASLHPRSQRRLIHFLLWLTRTKQLQVILTTHSPYVLEELPSEARVFLERKSDAMEILYGATPDLALNRMDDIDRPELFAFAEDNESIVFASVLFRQAGVDTTRISFIDAGPANIVTAIGLASQSVRFPINAIGIVDGDQPKSVGCIRLPGNQAVERQVLTDIKESALKPFAQRFEISLASAQNALERTLSVYDHHDWPSNLARLLGQTISYTWETSCNVWVKHCLADNELERIRRFLDKHLQ